MQVFKTTSDHHSDVEIVGAGVAGAYGNGGVPVETAARTMPELQEKDAQGRLKLDENGAPIPLTGSKLTAAAKDWADRFPYLEVVSMNEEKARGLAAERGSLPELEGDDVLAASREYYERSFGNMPEPINTSAAEMNYGSREAAEIALAEAEAIEAAKTEVEKGDEA